MKLKRDKEERVDTVKYNLIFDIVLTLNMLKTGEATLEDIVDRNVNHLDLLDAGIIGNDPFANNFGSQFHMP